MGSPWEEEEEEEEEAEEAAGDVPRAVSVTCGSMGPQDGSDAPEEEEEDFFRTAPTTRTGGARDGPHPPPPLSPSLLWFHRQRYVHFVQAFFGLSPAAAEREARHMRTTHSTAIRPVTGSRRLSRRRRGAAGGGGGGDVVAAVALPRHSSVAVEGDFLFVRLVEQARARERQRMTGTAAGVAASCPSTRSPTATCSPTAGTAPLVSPPPLCGASPHLLTSMAVPPPPTATLGLPNTRCVALYYGFPSEPAVVGAATHQGEKGGRPAPSSSLLSACVEAAETRVSTDDTAMGSRPPGSSVDTATAASRARIERQQHPRAVLLALLTTSAVEKGEPLRLHYASYGRCVQEIQWYHRRWAPRGWHVGTSPSERDPRDLFQRGEEDENEKNGERESHSAWWAAGVKDFSALWPPHTSFYHGPGARFQCRVPQASYPFTLVELRQCAELGEKELGVVAAAPIPYATCFLYAGPLATTAQVEAWGQTPGGSAKGSAGPSPVEAAKPPKERKKEEEWEEEEEEDMFSDDTYVLALLEGSANGRHRKQARKRPPTHRGEEAKKKEEKEVMCFGQGISRYINHRYNLSPFGNVELCAISFSMRAVHLAKHPFSHFASSPSPLSSVPHLVSIPFFMTTTDIAPGQPVLAVTYGEDYDAKLERFAVAQDTLVPYMDAGVLNPRCGVGEEVEEVRRCPCSEEESLSPQRPWRGKGRPQRYVGDYRWALRVGDVVWRRRSGWAKGGSGEAAACPPAPPEEDLFIVLDVPLRGLEYVLLQPLRGRVFADGSLERWAAASPRVRAAGEEEEEEEDTRRGKKYPKKRRAAMPSNAVGKLDDDEDGPSAAMQAWWEDTVVHAVQCLTEVGKKSSSCAGSGSTAIAPPHRACGDVLVVPLPEVAPSVRSTPHGARASFGSASATASAFPHACVSSTVSLARLLPDVDYKDVSSPPISPSLLPRFLSSFASSLAASEERTPTRLSSCRWVVVPLAGLYARTAPVRHGSTVVPPPLWSPALWPLFRQEVDA